MADNKATKKATAPASTNVAPPTGWGGSQAGPPNKTTAAPVRYLEGGLGGPGGPTTRNFNTPAPKSASGGGGGGTVAATAPSDGGGGSVAGPAAPPPLTWSDGYTLDGAPAWWKGRIPSALNADTSYLAILNSLIPYMSPEDQVRVATNLARVNPEAFGMYSADVMNTLQDQFPTEVGSDLVSRFNSAERGSAILDALNKFQSAAGMTKDTEGTRFLKDVAASLRDFGGSEGSGQTRTKQSQLRGLLDPMISSANTNELSAFGEIAKTLAYPFFSAGELTPTTKLIDGRLIMGAPNAELF